MRTNDLVKQLHDTMPHLGAVMIPHLVATVEMMEGLGAGAFSVATVFDHPDGTFLMGSMGNDPTAAAAAMKGVLETSHHPTSREWVIFEGVGSAVADLAEIEGRMPQDLPTARPLLMGVGRPDDKLEAFVISFNRDDHGMLHMDPRIEYGPADALLPAQDPESSAIWKIVEYIRTRETVFDRAGGWRDGADLLQVIPSLEGAPINMVFGPPFGMKEFYEHESE